MQAYTGTSVSRMPTAAAIAAEGVTARPPQFNILPLKAAGVPRALVKGEELFAEGDAADFFYRVVSGTVRTYKLLSDGRRQIDEFHLSGDIFGLESGRQHRFSAESVDDATVVAIRRQHFAALAHDDPELGAQVMKSMMRNLERAHDHMVSLGRKTAREKIATFLLDMARRTSNEDRFELPMQRSDIADHLGLTIETVSRTLTQLTRDGLIRLAVAGRIVVLCDKAGLRHLNA